MDVDAGVMMSKDNQMEKDKPSSLPDVLAGYAEAQALLLAGAFVEMERSGVPKANIDKMFAFARQHLGGRHGGSGAVFVSTTQTLFSSLYRQDFSELIEDRSSVDEQ